MGCYTVATYTVIANLISWKTTFLGHNRTGKRLWPFIPFYGIETAYLCPKLRKPLKFVTHTQTTNSDKSPLQIQAPGTLYSEIALKFKIKQSKTVQ